MPTTPRLASSLRLLLLAAGCALVLPACPFSDKQSLAHEAATELNLNSRFDRTQLTIERVAAKERAEFTRSHRLWGGEVRVTDAEIAGFKMVTPQQAEVQVHVVWFFLSEGELKNTVLKQKFEDDNKGHFLLVSEERTDGDLGLLGERYERAMIPADQAEPPAQFPTVRIGAND